jgi:hypothetical protein
MNDWLKDFAYRLSHDRDSVRLNPLIHIFFYITLVNGIFFTFLTGIDSVQQSVLYVHTKQAFGTTPLPFWGVCAILVTVVNTWAIYTRRRRTIANSGLAGFAVWLFAFIIYAQDLLWFQMLAGAVPNLAFWTWYYFRVKWHYVDKIV